MIKLSYIQFSIQKLLNDCRNTLDQMLFPIHKTEQSYEFTCAVLSPGHTGGTWLCAVSVRDKIPQYRPAGSHSLLRNYGTPVPSRHFSPSTNISLSVPSILRAEGLLYCVGTKYLPYGTSLVSFSRANQTGWA